MHPQCFVLLQLAWIQLDTYQNTEMKVPQHLTGVEDVYVYDDTFS